MILPPYILRSISAIPNALRQVTLPLSATLLSAHGHKSILPAFKRVLNGIRCGGLTPFLGWEGMDR